MQIKGSVALVTGANRGLGRAYAAELVSRGAAKVYGAARDPAAVTEPGVTPIALDITDPERVGQVAQDCADVSLLVNNAGVLKYSTFINAPNLDAARAEMEVNYFGTLSMCRAFAPVLAVNGGGAIVNMLSVTSFYTNPLDASYGASKAGQVEVLADERSRTVKAELSRDHELIYPPIQEFWDDAVKGTS
jgi:NAD(P)-dependent dehydrogenase (short-subunit alcohol dehydrogenase family)